MRLVFADIDGVFNTPKYPGPSEEDKKLFRGDLYCALDLDPEKVKLLNTIVEIADANIVVSSSWAHSRSDAVLASIFHVRGLKDPGRVIGSLALDAIRTQTGRDYKFECHGIPYVRNNRRLRCILYYLDRVKPESFVILEDTWPMGPLEDHTVRTQMSVGLLPEHVDQALAILRSKK